MLVSPELAPVPIKRLASAALKPWWGGAAGGVGERTKREAALRQLMGWQE